MAREWDVLPPAPCKGCGGQHGAVNAEINCLRKRVDVLESRVTRLNRIDESVAAFHRVPTTTGGAFAAQSLARDLELPLARGVRAGRLERRVQQSHPTSFVEPIGQGK